MEKIRISLAQVNPTVGDLDGNARLVRDAIEAAKGNGADLVALPELVLTGYPPEDLLLKPSFVEDNLRILESVAESARGIAAVVGFVQPDGPRLYNAAALLADGRVRGVYRKHVLPNYGVFDEKRYFEPASGILLGELGDATFGITICEDLWSEHGPHAACAAAGADLIVNVNGSPYHRGKGAQRRALLETRARENGVAFAYVNMVGGQDELVFDGQSCVVGPDGELLARAAQFEEDLLTVDFVVDDPRGPGSVAEPVERVRVARGAAARPPQRRRIAPELDDVGEVYRALVLGTADYLGKNGFRQAVIGLSGGIDSALTAAIAADAIGATNVLGVLLPTEYTSQESLDYAEDLARKLGIEAVTLPIGDAYEALLKTLDPVFRDTPWGLAEENLQARVRGTLLMAISNKTNRIVLTTGNKSEMAAGYATLYGDMAGGFAVLKDVPKTLVYELSRWRNGRGEVIPVEIIERPPTAELRHGQLDTDSLPPYESLDPALEAYVEEFESVPAMVERGVDEQIAARIASMVDRAEYKRRQAPPGVKITHRAFGRDRRVPITNRYRAPSR
ncbi:MAG TPA: NAD+ synthase [Actinomycetota bacterium]|nr:NAD+ synthase [Actinomycetota bacterium]